VLRRVWTKRGRRPAATSHPRYEWLYLYGFVRPLAGLVEWFVGSTVDADLFSEILAGFARAVGAGPRKLVLLVLDGAGWHVSARLRVPDGLRLIFLPPYSPELQPAERLWPLAREGVANRHFGTLAELEAKLTARCRTLRDDPTTIKANTLFHWWPKTA
jgi:transposase